MASQISLSVGSLTVAIKDPSVVAYADRNGDGALDALRAALICGVSAMDSAVASKEIIALEARLSSVQSDVSAKIGDSSQALIKLLENAANPAVDGSIAGCVEKSLDAKAREILSNLDPSNPKSPYAMLAAELRAVARDLIAGSVKENAKKAVENKLAAKGRVFEDSVSATLAEAAIPFSDIVEPTGDETGLGSSKKGDAIIRCSGPRPLSIVVEAKHKKISLTRRFVETELRAGMSNRGADAAILVVHPEFAACVGAPVKLLADNIIACVFDPESGDPTALLIAYHLTRAFIFRDQSKSNGVDVSLVSRRLEVLAAKVEEIGVAERSMTQSLDDLDRCRGQFGVIRRGLLRDIQDLTLEIIGDTGEALIDVAAEITPICIEGAMPEAEHVIDRETKQIEARTTRSEPGGDVPVF